MVKDMGKQMQGAAWYGESDTQSDSNPITSDDPSTVITVKKVFVLYLEYSIPTVLPHGNCRNTIGMYKLL